MRFCKSRRRPMMRPGMISTPHDRALGNVHDISTHAKIRTRFHPDPGTGTTEPQDRRRIGLHCGDSTRYHDDGLGGLALPILSGNRHSLPRLRVVARLRGTATGAMAYRDQTACILTVVAGRNFPGCPWRGVAARNCQANCHDDRPTRTYHRRFWCYTCACHCLLDHRAHENVSRRGSSERHPGNHLCFIRIDLGIPAQGRAGNCIGCASVVGLDCRRHRRSSAYSGSRASLIFDPNCFAKNKNSHRSLSWWEFFSLGLL